MNAFFWFGLLLGFVAMEIFSYYIHKHLFHGPLWQLHQSHHVTRRGIFEKNDLFSVGFGVIAMALMMMSDDVGFQFGVGAGISVYGVVYFVLHDLITHRRFMPIEIGKENPSSQTGAERKSRKSLLTWARRIRDAHRIHHQRSDLPGQEPYGLLWFPKPVRTRPQIVNERSQ